MRVESITYEFASRKVFQERPPFVQVSNGATSEGYIEISIPFIQTPSITPELYKLTRPTSTEPRYIKTGSNLYTVEILFNEVELLDNSNSRIHWLLDTGALAATTGDYYGITFKLNDTSKKSTVDIVILITSES